MAELLFEVYSEEIPSHMQEYGGKKLYDLVLAKLEELFVQKFQGRCFFTPCRIGFYIENVPNLLSAKPEEIRGPRITASKQAVSGFLKKYNVIDINNLMKKGEYYYYVKKSESKSTKELLKSLLEGIIVGFPWPKSMKWGSYKIRWIRPIHSMLFIYNGDVIPLVYGHIKASNKTFAHWMLNSQSISVSSFAEYKLKLQENGVSIFQEQRIESIRKQAKKICNEQNVLLIEDEELLKEVANLVETPYVALGKIEEEFMELPKEVLITTLKFHQKYLMTEYNSNKLAPYFIIVSAIKTDDNFQTVISGNKRVLRARLADAQFFYKQDCAIRLIDRFSALKKVTFHHEIGSYWDKIQNIKRVAISIAEQLQITDIETIMHTALLIKADLTTEIVKELPELQGIAGYYYALKDGENENIANAIKEHYLPQGPKDTVPTSYLSIIMSLSDKIVTLNSMFAIGIKPTGSKDPFALRRAAIGIIRIICANQLNLKLKNLLRKDVLEFISYRITSLSENEENTYFIDLKYIRKAL